MNKYVVKTKDKTVTSVIRELDKRSVAGIEKYGTTLDENKTDDFLQHLLEEVLDAANYIKKLQRDKEAPVENELDISRITEYLNRQEHLTMPRIIIFSDGSGSIRHRINGRLEVLHRFDGNSEMEKFFNY